MSIERNREIICQLYRTVTLMRHPEAHYKQTSVFTQYTASAKPSSLKTFRSFFAAVKEAFPDYELTIDSLITKENRVMARYTIYGTQTGYFMGQAPSNKRMTITGIDVFRVDNGKVTEHWDAAHQICAIPPVNKQPTISSSKWEEATFLPLKSSVTVC